MAAIKREPPVRDPLSEAAARRHELTRAKAIQALRELDRAGTPVTFSAVASAARIYRSWLYTPAGQRATDASLRARLTAALARNQRLTDENTQLRRQLARALGEQRSSRTRS